MGAAGGPLRRATPGSDVIAAGTLAGMAPSRDDDLDWLYGRDHPRPSEPEPTRVLPSDPSVPAAPPAGPADGHQQPTGQRPRQPPPGQVRPVPAPPPQTGPRAPARTRRTHRLRVAQQATRRRPGQKPKQKHPVRRFFSVLAIVLAALLVWLIAVPVYAWTRIERVDDVPSGDRPANQPGTTFLLVGSDSREGLTKAEQKKLGTGSTAGQADRHDHDLVHPAWRRAGADLGPPRLLRADPRERHEQDQRRVRVRWA